MAMAVVFAFLAFASVSPIFAQQPVKEADAAIGDGEFRMIVDASTGHDPTKSEVDQWLAGGEPNQAPIGSLENPFKQIQTCVNVQHQLCLQWSLSRSTGGRFGTGPPTDDDSNGDGGHGWQTDGWQQSHHICAVRTGTYRESVSVSDWPEQCSLRVEAYNNELVTTVLVKGTADISNLTWQPYKGSIMMASLPDEFIAQHPEPFQQIFHNEVMMMEARWPNAKLEDMLSPTAWSRTEKGSVYGRIEDKDLYAAGVDWTGALATLNVAHQFYTWTRYVQSYSRDAAAKSASFTYPRDLPGITSWATRANATAAWTGHQYFLSGKLDALDSPGEWFLDVTNDSSTPKWTLYFWPPGDSMVNTSLEVKVRSLCFNASHTSRFVLTDMAFFGCTFTCNQCIGALVANVSLLYPTYDKFIPEMGPVDQELGDEYGLLGVDSVATRQNWQRYLSSSVSAQQRTVATKIEGEHNTVINLTLYHSNNHGLDISGTFNHVLQVLVVDTCWLGTLIYTPVSMSGSDNMITYSTAAYFGNAGITTHGPNEIVAYCQVHNGGLIGLDTAGIYTGSPTDHGAQYHHNWVRDMREKCIRGDDLSANMTVHHNVMANCGEPNGDVRRDGIGLVIKGLGHVIYANTMINCQRVSRCMPACGSPYKPWDCHGNTCPLLIIKQNVDTLYFNNAQHNQTGQMCGCGATGDATYAGGIASGIFNGTEADMKLANPREMDYTPTQTSPLVDRGVIKPPYTNVYVGKAPDIGAYEYGGEVWKPGCAIHKDC